VPLPEAVVAAEQVREALAVFEAPHEEDVQCAVAQLVERLGIGEGLDLDPVGDDPVVRK
jgi:hypothetical protein